MSGHEFARHVVYPPREAVWTCECGAEGWVLATGKQHPADLTKPDHAKHRRNALRRKASK